jgi:DNA-binding PadR family transcriptional regulator
MGKPAPGGLTALGFVVLGLLAERPMHPYEMYQTVIDRQEDRLVKVRPGSLYHTVARLADHQLIRAAGTDRAGNRPERTVYELTKSGRVAQIEWCTEYLGTPVREYPNFAIALHECHNLPREQVVELLRNRIQRQGNEVAQLRAICDWLRDHGIPRRYWVGAEFQQQMLAAEVDWLTGLVDELAADRIPWLIFDEESGIGIEPEEDPIPQVVLRWGWSQDPSITTKGKASEE